MQCCQSCFCSPLRSWDLAVVQIGSDAVSSPIPYDGLLWVGISGTAAEGDEADRHAFQGSSVLLATDTAVILDACDGSTPFVVKREELIDYRRFNDGE